MSKQKSEKHHMSKQKNWVKSLYTKNKTKQTKNCPLSNDQILAEKHGHDILLYNSMEKDRDVWWVKLVLCHVIKTQTMIG